MKDQKGYNDNIGKDDVMVTLEEYANLPNHITDTNEKYTNEKDNGFPYPDDTAVDNPVSEYDEECEEEEIDEDSYYQESLENNQLYKLEREKYVDALETIKELTKKLLEFL